MRTAPLIDPRMAEAQKAIDAALPGTTNTIPAETACRPNSFGSTRHRTGSRPASCCSTRGQQVHGLPLARPWIDAKQMGQRDFFRFRARDGMEIRSYVTLPPQ